MFNKREKITVEIQENGLIIKKKDYPIKANKIIIRPDSKRDNKPEYAPTFTRDSVLSYKYKPLYPFPPSLWAKKVILINGASKCVDWITENKEEEKRISVLLNQWDRESLEEVFDKGVIKNAGNINNKLDIPIMFYILLGIGSVLSFITLLAVTGRLQI